MAAVATATAAASAAAHVSATAPASVAAAAAAAAIQAAAALRSAHHTVHDKLVADTVKNWEVLWPLKTGESVCRFTKDVIRQILKNLLAKLPPSNAPIADHRDRLEEVYVEIQKKRELASASASGTSS
jgi:3-oxoacyl-ACP reductase-like protein